jgi:hypothetical protein
MPLAKIERQSWMMQGCAPPASRCFVLGGYRFDLLRSPTMSANTVSSSRRFRPVPCSARSPAGRSSPSTGGSGSRAVGSFLFNQDGDANYLFGKTSPRGWWLFFPVAVALKTPIGFLVLAAAGLVMAFLQFRGPRQHNVTAFFAIAILLVCMTSRINLGPGSCARDLSASGDTPVN